MTARYKSRSRSLIYSRCMCYTYQRVMICLFVVALTICATSANEGENKTALGAPEKKGAIWVDQMMDNQAQNEKGATWVDQVMDEAHSPPLTNPKEKPNQVLAQLKDVKDRQSQLISCMASRRFKALVGDMDVPEKDEGTWEKIKRGWRSLMPDVGTLIIILGIVVFIGFLMSFYIAKSEGKAKGEEGEEMEEFESPPDAYNSGTADNSKMSVSVSETGSLATLDSTSDSSSSTGVTSRL